MKVYKTTYKRKKAKKYWLVFAVLSVVSSIFAFFHLVVNPIIVKTTYAQVDSLATTEISDAIYDAIKQGGFSYEDLVSISYNSDGNISSIVSNTINLNILARDVSTLSQIYLDTLIDKGVDIPLGSLTGITFLAGRGTKVNFKLVLIGSIITSFKSSFVSAGINQTMHNVSIVVNVDISIILPFKSEHISFTTDVVVCENIIVGDIPNIYLKGNLFN